MSLEKITTQQMDAKGVCAAPDVLSGTPAQNKAVFDRMVRELIAPAYNAAVDAVNALEETESGIEAAEALRVSAEELRAAAETARAEAESGRAEAEQQRQDAETQRQDLETGYVARSENGAKASESWAVGGTGTREGEDTNNAKYWSEQAAAVAGGGVISFKGRTGSVIPASGDYTAEMVGAYSKEETNTLLQNKANSSDVYTKDEVDTLFQEKGTSAEVRVMGDVGTTVTMTRGSKTLSGTVASTGYATLYPTELGDWTITFTYDGSQKVRVFTLEVIGIVTVPPFVVGNSLEETSWSDLSIMSKFGVCDKYFKVGDTKNITVNGVSYPVQIIGFNHDKLTSGGTASMTFQLVNCLDTKYQMETSNTNANGWEGCLMRKTTLNSTIYNQLNSDLKAVIKAVNKVSSVGNKSSDLETTSDNLFLLSEIEIFGSITLSFAGEGKQYEYYAAGNSTIKTVSGSATDLWQRSPRNDDTNGFCDVTSVGNSYRSSSSSSLGVSFGFCV